MLRGAQLTRLGREREHKRLGNFARADLIDSDRLLRDASLNNHRVKILQTARQFRLAAKRIIQFVELLVKQCGLFEIQRFAGVAALGFQIFT